MGATLSSIENALKENYYGGIVNRINNATIYYAQLKRDSESVQASGKGLKAIFPLQTRDNQGLGTRAENAVLPTARQTTDIQLEVPLKYTYGEIRFTGPAVAAAAKNATRFAEVVDREIKSMTTSMRNEIGMQVISPNTGFLCQINGAVSTSSTITVDHPGTIWIRKGMPIETRAVTEASGVVTVAAIDSNDISYGLTEATAHQVGNITSNTVFKLEDYTSTVTEGESCSTNRYVFRYGSVVTGTTPSQINGLLSIIDNYTLSNADTSSWFGLGLAVTTIQNKARGTYSELEANIVHNSGSNQGLSEDLVQEALDKVAEATGEEGHKGQMLLMDNACRRTFINLLQADRRFSPDTLKLKGGYSSAAYQAGNDVIPLVADRQIPSNCILIPNLKYLRIFNFKDFDWMDRLETYAEAA